MSAYCKYLVYVIDKKKLLTKFCIILAFSKHPSITCLFVYSAGAGGNSLGEKSPGGKPPGGNSLGGKPPGGNSLGGKLPGGNSPGGNLTGGNLPGGNFPGGKFPVTLFLIISFRNRDGAN